MTTNSNNTRDPETVRDLRVRLALGIVAAVIASALASFFTFMLLQSVMFYDVAAVFGINAYIRYELPFHPLVAGPVIWLLWRYAPHRLTSYAWPAAIMGVLGAVVSVYVRLALGDESLIALVHLSNNSSTPNLFTILLFGICALPISLAASVAGWGMMHVVVRVPTRNQMQAA